ncbi:methyltransferase domain-containing protein [Hippea maritima]|uniref:Methyltransferase type 11 n=1 Tax=Hippea maritima (strain ATCC 700847 / DSM 10411 / MH2) TaxID=760142 RepID=F2LVV4_HIPMA|nr:methyltransferase domain-containing protein [Hippea maritima]AEA33888.1 Methyltransferase type 11 [Hippea maritima DSM 10411]
MKSRKGSKLKVKPKSFGPVEDFESFVKPDWWKDLFNPLYLISDGDVVEDSEITKSEVDLVVKALGIKPEDKVLDLCCGQGRHSIELASRGFLNVEGLDRSRYLIQKARKESEKRALGIKFREGDARKLPYKTDTFDAVLILGNSFGYFESEDEDLKVLKEVLRVLKPWGKVLLDVVGGEYLKSNLQNRSWEWVDNRFFVCRERSLSTDGKRIITREIIAHKEKGIMADQFYSVRLYSKEKLQELLKKSGFDDVEFHSTLSVSSKRNQDLGMMGHRIIVTALTKKQWTFTKVKDASLKTVAVVMGDPNKPDNMKPNGIFDEDDFYTIDELKKALNELKNYRFIYVNNHDTLISDLIKLKPKIDFVFNLCDEGFNNEPTKELYIPALLEMLNIPYTGSNPQCLAYCYDKSLIRGVAKEMGIPVPKGILVTPDKTVLELPFNFPAIVKPNFGDSSFGITKKSVVYTMDELIEVLSEIKEQFGHDKPVLIEEFLTGSDLTIGIIGNISGNYKILPIIEEDYSKLPDDLPKICGYEAKWLPGSPYWNNTSRLAQLDEETERIIVESSLKLWERLNVNDYCRFDWRLDSESKPKLLEVNPNPGWCWDGHLAKMAKIAGISYGEMLNMILEAAAERFESSKTREIKNDTHLTQAINVRLTNINLAYGR